MRRDDGRPDNRTSQVRCNYAIEHTLPAKGEAKTYALATDSKAKGTAAYESYCRQVAETLGAYGWRRIPADGKDAVATPDYWVDVIFGYALDHRSDAGSFQRIAAPMMVSDEMRPVGDIYAKVSVYYAAVAINTKPLGEGDCVFLAQIFGSSDAQMPLVLPTMFKQVLKDFPAENVKSAGAILYTRR